jgi:hypothetical protein
VADANQDGARGLEADLPGLIDEYRAGLEAEIVVLHRLEEAAARQHRAAEEGRLADLHQAADERDALTTALVTLEARLRDVREALARSRPAAERLDGYAEALALHKEAIALVSRILKTDGDSLEALAAAELARREAARAMEQGETTLAAYRRVMMTPHGATLVDRRG